MAQLEIPPPSKTYRGTVAEVLRHLSEIPPDTVVELNVFEAVSEPLAGEGFWGGKSITEMFPDLIGTEKGTPTDISENPEKYMQSFGATKHPRTLEP